MKFTEKLSAHLTPEWRKQYIGYTELKAMLTEAVDKVPVDTSVNKRVSRSYYASFDEEFLRECENELKKINTFYAEKLAEATRKYAALNTQLSRHIDDATRKSRTRIDERVHVPKRKLQQLKLNYSELYLSLVLLQNYQSLNHTGFRKILKKHDKLLNTDTGAKWFEEFVDKAFFYTNKDILNLIRQTESTFTNVLEGGDRARAMKRLRVPPLNDMHYPWTTFRVGLFSGALLVLFVAIYLSFNSDNISPMNQTACIRLFRGPFLLILFLFLIGVNIHGWRKSGVNHILIFEIDPRDHLTALHVMEMAAAFGVLWALCVLGFIYHVQLDIPPFVYPLLLFLLMIAFLINPLPVFHHSSRVWLLRLTGRVVTAPFHHVGFADFWLGDQLNSLVTSLVDYEYIICFYLTNWSWTEAVDLQRCNEKDFTFAPIVRCLPAWFRFAQCLHRYQSTKLAFPFLVNAGKYATTFAVVLFATLMSYHKDSYESTFQNPFVWGYLISYTVSTMYCYAWDVLKDFGVFAKFSGENIFLREQIVYSSSFYYFAIIEDLLLRLLWIVSFYATEQDLISAYNMTTIAAILEVFRRYIWNYLRLENEHLFNAGNFRAVRDMSITPIDPKDQILLQRMMDELDGVENRQNVIIYDKED